MFVQLGGLAGAPHPDIWMWEASFSDLVVYGMLLLILWSDYEGELVAFSSFLCLTFGDHSIQCEIGFFQKVFSCVGIQ